MSYSERVLKDTLEQMAAGLSAEIIKNNRPISPIEVATIALTLALTESAGWLRDTLEQSMEDRLKQIVAIELLRDRLLAGELA